MLIEIKIPVFAESVTEGTIAALHKKVGDAVARDENLADIETDKIMLELPAPQAGVLVELTVAVGDTVTSQQVIGKIDTAASATAAVQAVAAEVGVPANAIGFGTAVAPRADGETLAMPAAKKLAAETGVDLAGVAGSGRDGRVLKEDVAAAAAKPAAAPAKPAAAPVVALPVGDRPEQRVPMTRLRKVVAERLVQSQQTNAILTTFNEVNMKPLMDLRNLYKDKFEKAHGVKLGFMGFFVKAAVHALKKYPIINASVDGTDIVYHGYFDIGVAVGSPRGLVVPVIRNADLLSLADIEKQRRHLHHLQRRHLWLDDVHPDHQPAAIRHPRHALHQGARRGGKRPDRGSPDDVPGAILRPPHHRRPRSRAEPGGHQGSH